MTNALLQAEGLAFGYPGRRVGANLDLAVAQGEVVCLLGPNGCGKSTLFRTLLGLIPMLAGRALLAGCDLARYTRREIACLVAYVPQAQVSTFAYTVEDIVMMGRAARVGTFAGPARRDRHAVAGALRRLGIARLASRHYTEISGGERQLALIARALAQEAPLIVMDEPGASLDFGNQVRVLNEIASLRAQGMSALLSTHQPDHALRVGDRFALMKAGRLLACGRAVEVMTPPLLADLYEVSVSDFPASHLMPRHAPETPPP